MSESRYLYTKEEVAVFMNTVEEKMRKLANDYTEEWIDKYTAIHKELRSVKKRHNKIMRLLNTKIPRSQIRALLNIKRKRSKR
jgi:hypothetical protein